MTRRATKPPEPWKYPTPQSRAKKEVRVSRPKFGAPYAEVLSGQVQNKTASAPEERLCRAIDKSPDWQGYEFRKKIIEPSNVLGSIEIDVWAYNSAGEPRALRVDGDWVHAQPETVKKDKEDLDKINNYLRQRGLPVAIVIPGHKLDTQALADQTLAELS